LYIAVDWMRPEEPFSACSLGTTEVAPPDNGILALVAAVHRALQVELTLPLEGDVGIIQTSGPHLLVARACAEVDAKAAGSKESEELRLEDLAQEDGRAEVGPVTQCA
jgi:hypothetical protein